MNQEDITTKGVGEVKIKEPLFFMFTPQEDITAYEVALMIPLILGRIKIFNTNEINPLLRRHITIC